MDTQANLFDAGDFNDSGNGKPYYVYLIIDTVVEIFKIGETDNRTRRLNEFQTGCPNTLKYVRTITWNSEKEAQRHERIFHRMLAAYRVRGEWFDVKAFLSSSVWLQARLIDAYLEYADWLAGALGWWFEGHPNFDEQRFDKRPQDYSQPGVSAEDGMRYLNGVWGYSDPPIGSRPMAWAFDQKTGYQYPTLAKDLDGNYWTRLDSCFEGLGWWPTRVSNHIGV